MGQREQFARTFIPDSQRIALKVWKSLLRRLSLSALFAFLSLYSWFDPEACAQQFKNEVQ